MKKLFLIILMFLVIFISNCSQEYMGSVKAEREAEHKNKSEVDLYFGGNHKLLALNNYVDIKDSTYIKSGFFCFLYKSTKENQRKASFVWLNNRNEYVFTELPITNVRFQINDTIKEPYCKFRWTNREISSPEEVSRILYVVLILKEENIANKNIMLELN
jgi:hypothetical protein